MATAVGEGLAPPVNEICARLAGGATSGFIQAHPPLLFEVVLPVAKPLYLLIRRLRHHLPGHGKATVSRRSVNGR